MSQILSLITPITPAPVPSTQTFAITRIILDRVPHARVSIGIVDNNGAFLDISYDDERGGTVAAQVISSLNTANLSIKSLQQRILERLVSDGKLPAGSVTGVPD